MKTEVPDVVVEESGPVQYADTKQGDIHGLYIAFVKLLEIVLNSLHNILF